MGALRRDPVMTQLARELRRNETNAEKLVWNIVRARRLGGLKFRRQFVVGRYIADFICLPARLVIEIDGATHDDPEADARRTAELERAGYRVVRLGNSYVYDSESAVAEVILDALCQSALPAAEKLRLDREGLFPTPLDAA